MSKTLISSCNSCGIKIYQSENHSGFTELCFFGSAPSDCSVCGYKITKSYDELDGVHRFSLLRNDDSDPQDIYPCPPQTTGPSKPKRKSDKRPFIIVGVVIAIIVLVFLSQK